MSAFRLFALAATILFAIPAHADVIGTELCDGCTPMQRQTAASGAAPEWSGTYGVYVLDNVNRLVEKFQIAVENEPGFSFIQVTPLQTEPAIAEFVSKYWQERDRAQQADWVVDDAFAAGIADYLANFQARGRTMNNFSDHGLPSQLEAPGISWTILSQLVQKIPGFQSGDSIEVKFRFSDGGTIRLKIKLSVVTSPTGSYIALSSYEIVPGSAQLDGIVLPDDPSGFGGYQDIHGNGLNDGGIEALYRLTQMWGLATVCVPRATQTRFTCDSQGRCTLHTTLDNCPWSWSAR